MTFYTIQVRNQNVTMYAYRKFTGDYGLTSLCNVALKWETKEEAMSDAESVIEALKNDPVYAIVFRQFNASGVLEDAHVSIVKVVIEQTITEEATVNWQ